MDETTRSAVLAAAEELFDRDALYKLASSVGEARGRKGLRFWQENMLARLSEHSGIDVTTKTKFIAAFKGTKRRWAPPEPDTSDAGILKYMEAVWANPKDKTNWMYGVARDLSKIGTLEPYARCYRALAKFLSFEEVIELHRSLRDQSMRCESEWRHEFLRYFKKSVKEAELPERLEHERGIEQGSDAPNPRTKPHDDIPF